MSVEWVCLSTVRKIRMKERIEKISLQQAQVIVFALPYQCRGTKCLSHTSYNLLYLSYVSICGFLWQPMFKEGPYVNACAVCGIGYG